MARSITTIQQVYTHLFGYEHVDTEFAITRAGDVRLLQSRPVVKMDATNVVTVGLLALRLLRLSCHGERVPRVESLCCDTSRAPSSRWIRTAWGPRTA